MFERFKITPRTETILAARIDEARDQQAAQGRDMEQVDRRELLIAGIQATSLLGATAVVGNIALHRGSEEPKARGAVTPQQQPIIELDRGREESWENKTLPVPSTLVGKRVPDMEWGYYAPLGMLGVKDEYVQTRSENGTVTLVPTLKKELPPVIPPVPFHENLANLFSRKEKLAAGQSDEAEQLELYQRLTKQYQQKFENGSVRKMSLSEFKLLIDNESNTVLAALTPAYSTISRTYFKDVLARSGDKEDKELLRKNEETLTRVLEQLAKQITPDMMIAYMATEIFPVPERSIDAMSFLLENAGVEFLQSVPALGDKLLSLGVFQLTKYVSGPKGSVNNMLRVMKDSTLVPGELSDFSSIEDHLRAGFLFAFHNTVALIRDLIHDGKYAELSTLLESASSGQSNGNSTVFLEYLAGAHHRPSVARRILSEWLTENQQVPVAIRPKSLANPAREEGAEKQVAMYMEKSRKCFAQLKLPVTRDVVQRVG